ncbi:unnamed protein product [Cylicocyclus nassatus]|uniref:DEAD/DEAH-box helicase domain-containing protein n=1 Tax=Cylicocyclus nassatus TaxID=53992 RepID=A0AA36M9Z4_CYLNA|nr:unnamed protein product [Cylicocyclus nassatus]
MGSPLPKGSTRECFRTHEEVEVPPMNAGSIGDVQHMFVKDMDNLKQLGLQGFEKLNVIQNIVFEQAYKTKQNLLISAPTGAGKTSIAIVAIFNTNLEHRMLNGESGAVEKRWSNEREMELSETQMLVLTPEKWDVVTRKGVHLMHKDRGPVIKTIVARTLRQVYRVKEVGGVRHAQETMNDVCYDEVLSHVKKGHQVLRRNSLKDSSTFLTSPSSNNSSVDSDEAAGLLGALCESEGTVPAESLCTSPANEDTKNGFDQYRRANGTNTFPAEECRRRHGFRSIADEVGVR